MHVEHPAQIPIFIVAWLLIVKVRAALPRSPLQANRSFFFQIQLIRNFLQSMVLHIPYDVHPVFRPQSLSFPDRAGRLDRQVNGVSNEAPAV